MIKWFKDLIELVQDIKQELREINKTLSKIYSAKDFELSQKYMSQWSRR